MSSPKQNPFVCGKEIAVHGKLIRIAKLRHEWCDFLDDPGAAVAVMRKGAVHADVLTFVSELGEASSYSYLKESAVLAVLPVKSYDDWWEHVGYKTRNKLRKGLKSGVDYRVVELTDELAQGLQEIYNESPVRQGRRFYHYGKSVAAIKEELSSFPNNSILVGAYFEGKLVGFMKLFEGKNVLRTVHIIAKIDQRDKNIMDILILKGVELCSQKKITNFQYGSWTDGGIGTFREKHGFDRVGATRYFVPLNWRGRLILACRLHKPIRELMPQPWAKAVRDLRAKWNAHRFTTKKLMSRAVQSAAE